MEDSVDVSKEYVDTIKRNMDISYELYLKMLAEYFKEDINIDQE